MKIDTYTGKTVELIEMPDDPDPVAPGSRAKVISEVEFYDRLHLNVEWEDGVNRSLNLLVPPDVIKIVEE